MALRSRVVDFPFVAGLLEGTDPQHINTSGFTKVTNGWYDKDGRISKRPGITRRATGDISVGTRLGRFGDALLVMDRTTGIYNYTESDATITGVDKLPECTVERRSVRHDIVQQVEQSDMAVSNGYAVYVVFYKTDKLNAFELVELDTGAVLTTETAIGSTASKQARMATSGSGNYIIEVHQYDATAEIWGTIWDCSTDPPTKGTTTQIKSANANLRDVCAIPGDRWCLVWQNTSTGNLTASEITISATAPVVGNEFTVSSTTTSACAAYISGTNMIVAWTDATPTTDYDIVDTTGFTSSLGTTTITAAATGGLSACPAALTNYAMVGMTGLGGVSWVDVNTSGTVGTIQTTYRVAPRSKVFNVNGLIYQWASWGSALPEGSMLLLQLAFSQTVEVRPVASASYGAMYAVQSFLSNVAEVTSATEYRTVMSRYLFPAGFTWTGVDELVIRFNEANLYESRQFGASTYISGGLMMQYTGSKCVEHNYCMAPEVTASVNTGIFNLSAGAYIYAFVYERMEENGEITRGRPVFADSISPSLNQGADLTVWADTATTYTEGTATRPLGAIVVYRTLANGKNWYYVTQKDNDPTDTATISFSEGQADGNVKDNPIMYTTGGVLENDPVWGGVAALAVHKNRLWALSSEDRTKLYYSQVQIDAEPAEFNLAQYVQVPRRCNQIESLDDALIAFSEEPNGAIYAFFGEGPTTTGQGSTLSDAVLIAGDCGCKDPRSVIQTPVGIFFRSDKGFTLLDRSRQVSYIGAPVEDSLDSYPTVRWAQLYPADNQVRFGCQDSGGENSIILVYDWVQQKWARWEHGLNIVDCQPMRTGNLAYLTASGDLWEERPGTYTDVGASTTAVTMTIETGWLNFDTLQGFKRLKRVSVLGNRKSAHGLQLRIAYNYNTSYATTLSFTEAAVTAFDHEQARFHVPRQKGDAWRFELTDTAAATPGEGVNFTGLSFEVGYKSGLHKQPAAEST